MKIEEIKPKRCYSNGRGTVRAVLEMGSTDGGTGYDPGGYLKYKIIETRSPLLKPEIGTTRYMTLRRFAQWAVNEIS